MLMATFLLIIVGIGLINSLVMSVMERKREIGLLQALGLKVNSRPENDLCRRSFYGHYRKFDWSNFC